MNTLYDFCDKIEKLNVFYEIYMILEIATYTKHVWIKQNPKSSCRVRLRYSCHVIAIPTSSLTQREKDIRILGDL